MLPQGQVMGEIGAANGVSFENIYPARPRGRLIVQSAGIDGHYFSTSGKGWATNAQDGRRKLPGELRQ